MQGIIVTPNGDVWALDNGNDQIVYLPGGDASKGRILGRTADGKPVDGTLQVKAPFHLAIDQQDRIWVTNSSSDTVTRFPTNDPGRAEDFKVGFAPRAIAIDSQGNAWVVVPTISFDLLYALVIVRLTAEIWSGSMSRQIQRQNGLRVK
jgi:streptogramin lyase